MRLIPKWLEDTDAGTWIGHWIQGLLGFWPGYLLAYFTQGGGAMAVAAGVLTGFLVVLCVFAHREGDNIRSAAKLYGWPAAIRAKGLDGVMDLTMPILAVFADIQLVRGSVDGFIAALLAAASVFGIVMLYKHNTKGR